MNSRERQSLDRHITGNGGEDQMVGDDLQDVQQQLDDHLANLGDVSLQEYGDNEATETGVAVSDMLNQIIKAEIGKRARHWDMDLRLMPIGTLRRVANIAGRYGLTCSPRLSASTSSFGSSNRNGRRARAGMAQTKAGRYAKANHQGGSRVRPHRRLARSKDASGERSRK